MESAPARSCVPQRGQLGVQLLESGPGRRVQREAAPPQVGQRGRHVGRELRSRALHDHLVAEAPGSG